MISLLIQKIIQHECTGLGVHMEGEKMSFDHFVSYLILEHDVRLGTTLHAQGSCYLELGATKVSAAVYGPREVARRSEFSTSGQLSCELRFAPFAGRRRRGHLPDDQQRELSQTLRTAVEPAVCLHEFPKSSVDVFVHVLQDDGGALAAAITAAGAALADANVPMYDLVTAAALRHSGGADLMDPDGGDPAPPADPEPDGGQFSHVTVGYLTQLQQVSCLYSEGLVSAAALNSSVRSLVTACQQLYVVVREKLLKKAGRPTANGTS
ncbi:exosome complex component MTR3-like isoform X2 [Amphibalanus amphitrite]|uniref:exosome complex component MTR3-like isoform X2 n=1 Tax=Amphibalanus amphitrite TaxID=1232801 RepID=UPI001C9225B5|nr:exosome complex component MTR3-like isoform X2 [Amphibalanus amphitrite]